VNFKGFEREPVQLTFSAMPRQGLEQFEGATLCHPRILKERELRGQFVQESRASFESYECLFAVRMRGWWLRTWKGIIELRKAV
jgi:hypothetical protein